MKKLLTLLLTIALFGANAQMITANAEPVYSLETVAITSYDLHDFYFQEDFKERKPGVAFLWSFLLAGGGQFYNGQTGKGVIMLGTSVVGAVLLIDGLSPVELEGRTSGTIIKSDAKVNIGAAMILVSSLWSMIDAPLMAEKLNEQNGLSLNLKPELFLDQRGRVAAGPGLSIKF